MRRHILVGNKRADIDECVLILSQGCVRRCWFSTWLPVWFLRIPLGSDSGNKRVTSKLCFISWRLQSQTMNTRSQGTKTEIDDDLMIAFMYRLLLRSSVNSLKYIDQSWLCRHWLGSGTAHWNISDAAVFLPCWSEPPTWCSISQSCGTVHYFRIDIWTGTSRFWTILFPSREPSCRCWLGVSCVGAGYPSLSLSLSFRCFSNVQHLFFHLWNQAAPVPRSRTGKQPSAAWPHLPSLLASCQPAC